MTVEATPKLTNPQEELLLALAGEVARSTPHRRVGIRTLAQGGGVSEKDRPTLLKQLHELGLVVIHDAGPGKSFLNAATLTALGRQVAFDRALVEPGGRVDEFAEGLSLLQLRVLDVVVEQEARAAGSSFTRAQVRAAVRNVSDSTVTLDQANDAVTSVAGRYLEVGAEAGSSARITGLGLLASKWGTNAVQIIDGLFVLLREALRKNVALRRYSWTDVRRGLRLPRKAADLFYVTVTRTGLGYGIYKDAGDDWWTVPDNLDEILEQQSAIAFLRRNVAVQAAPAVRPPEALVSPKGSDMVMQQPPPDPKKVFIIHGRNVAARNAVEQFVRSLGLEPLDFDQVSADLGGSPFVGQVVRRGMDLAKGIVALFTPDEFSALRPNFRADREKPEEIQRWQSRPNVIFEAGMAYGMTPDRTVLVTLGSEVSLFSDVAGIHLVRLDNNVETRKKLRQKLIGMKCSVDERADAWTDSARSGDFETCIEGLPEVSTRSPFTESGGASDAAAPRSDQAAAAVTSGVSLKLSYRKLPNSDGEIHYYELIACLRNGSRKRLDDWYIQVEFPTPLLDPEAPNGSQIRSDPAVTVFRSDSLKPILVDEEYPYKLRYRVDHELYYKYRAAIDQWIARSRAFVGGEQVAQAELEKLQEF